LQIQKHQIEFLFSQAGNCVLGRSDNDSAKSYFFQEFRGFRNAFRRVGKAAASFLGIGFFVRAVWFFASGLLSGPGNVRRAFSKMLSVFLLFEYNFLSCATFRGSNIDHSIQHLENSLVCFRLFKRSQARHESAQCSN
jgi:hypothetical protein